MRYLLVNWRTSLGGVAAILYAMASLAHQISTGVPLIQAITGPEVLGVILGYIGLNAKDNNVTGGNVAQPTIPNPPVLPAPDKPAVAP